LLAKAYSAAPRNATIAYHYAVVAAQRGNVASASEALANLPATGFPEAADAGKLREQLRARAAEESAGAAAR
jgi:hypothetical protein